MNTKLCEKAFLFSIFLCFIISCKDPGRDEVFQTTADYAQVTFTNNTQFHVRVYRDTAILLFDELAPGASRTGDIRESTDNNVGTTFRYSYRLRLSDYDDTFGGEAFAEGSASDLEETFVIEIGKEYRRAIPIPDNIVFNHAYIRIKNNASFNVLLRRIGTELLQLGNSELMIPAGQSGIYRIGRNDFNMDDYTLRNVETPYRFPSMTLSEGYVYDFIFTDAESIPRIISNVRWRIKPEPTSVWKKEITRFNANNFSDAGSAMNSHLESIARYGISQWRSNYPVNKLLYTGSSLVNGEQSFGVIPVIVQNTGVAAPYEIPLISAKDSEWENTVIPSTNLYAGTLSHAYQTVFNDIIKVGRNYVVLTTYSLGRRTGLQLFFLNEQGRVTDTLNIPPSNDREDIMGTKLVKLEDDSFLVLGSKKTYSNAGDEWFTQSSSFIYKYRYGSNEKVWSTEYSHPLHYANSSIVGLELADSYMIACYAGDNYSAKTVILKLNKSGGNITSVQSFGTANDSWRPFSAASDETGNIYITGIATEGASSKAYILKLDPSYTQVWLRKYGDMHDNFLFDLNITDNLLTAAGSGNNGSVAHPSFYGWQAGRGWVLRVDAGTGIVINEVFNDSVSAFNSVVRLDDGGFVFAAIKSIDNTKPYWFNTFAVKVNEHLAGE